MKKQYMWVVFIVATSFLVAFVTGCATDPKPLSRSEADAFVAQLIEFERLKKQNEMMEKSLPHSPEVEYFEIPERSLDDIMNENSCMRAHEISKLNKDQFVHKLSDLGIEDFLHYDSRVLYQRAREGKYFFYNDGAIIMKNRTIRIFHHKLPWEFKLRLVTPLNVREEDREAGGSKWGFVVKREY